MINRIKEIAQHFNLSSTAFADRVEIARPVISHIFSERNKPSLEVVQKIGMAFPAVDLEWLLYGKGEMLKKTAPKAAVQEKQMDPVSEPVPQLVEQPVAEHQEESETQPPAPKPAPPLVTSRKRAVKIVFIYDDNSFEEFWA